MDDQNKNHFLVEGIEDEASLEDLDPHYAQWVRSEASKNIGVTQLVAYAKLNQSLENENKVLRGNIYKQKEHEKDTKRTLDSYKMAFRSNSTLVREILRALDIVCIGVVMIYIAFACLTIIRVWRAGGVVSTQWFNQLSVVIYDIIHPLSIFMLIFLYYLRYEIGRMTIVRD